MKSGVRHRLLSRTSAAIHDLLVIPTAWLLAYWLRYNLETMPAGVLDSAILYLLIVVPVQAAAFWLFGLYRGIWRFASMPDLLRILKSTGLGLIVSLSVLFAVFRLEDVPRSVPVLYSVLLVVLLSGPRFVYRWFKDHRVSFSGGIRVLIVGAGRAGEVLARDLLRKGSRGYLPVAFVDDKRRRVGKDVHGVPIVGPCDSIPEVAERLEIEVIVLAVPSARVKDRKRLVELCERTRLPFRTVPQLENLMSGQVAINQLREVSIEDLLGREPVVLDWAGIKRGLTDRTVLMTGAGGSIGSELCRQIAQLGPGQLVLFENNEYNLYAIERELRERFPDLSLHACLGDVRDETSVAQVFTRFEPAIVFHAAAYKHVPMLEYHAREAVYNNVLGTRIVADAANRQGCSEFVLISTDKAVNPTNVMGTTKRVAEIYCQNLNAHSETRFVTVRFGNVLGSAGSVVPLFRQQIAAGGPLTVTHPEIERYFMTIPEACQLIMQAGLLGEGGEIFVLDMGEPVKISYLAEQMIRLSGKVPGEEIEIAYTGLRPGEKLFEELFHEQEALQPTRHEKILLAQHRSVDWDDLCGCLNEIQHAVAAHDERRIADTLCTLVPENRLRDTLAPEKTGAPASPLTAVG